MTPSTNPSKTTSNTSPIPPELHSGTTNMRGIIVITIAEILRATEPGPVREIALLSVMEQIRDQDDITFIQAYLTAKALNDDEDARNVFEGTVTLTDALAECEKVLNVYYPEFKTNPNVMQLLNIVKLLGETVLARQSDGLDNTVNPMSKNTRSVTAHDVFGVQSNTPAQIQAQVPQESQE